MLIYKWNLYSSCFWKNCCHFISQEKCKNYKPKIKTDTKEYFLFLKNKEIGFWENYSTGVYSIGN